MSMLAIATNIMGINTHRNLKTISGRGEKASEKLSSGFKINRAADDAAGLAISEKMRNQIKGLNQANRNVENGISLIQTAEGGMQEISEMVKRQRELTIQAMNDTNTTEDRQKIQMEIDQLTQEITATAGKTEFNGLPLLNVPLIGKDLLSSYALRDNNMNLFGEISTGETLNGFAYIDIPESGFISLSFTSNNSIDSYYPDGSVASETTTDSIGENVPSLILTSPNGDVYVVSPPSVRGTAPLLSRQVGALTINGEPFAFSAGSWVYDDGNGTRISVSSIFTSDGDYSSARILSTTAGRWGIGIENQSNTDVLNFSLILRACLKKVKMHKTPKSCYNLSKT